MFCETHSNFFFIRETIQNEIKNLMFCKIQRELIFAVRTEYEMESRSCRSLARAPLRGDWIPSFLLFQSPPLHPTPKERLVYCLQTFFIHKVNIFDLILNLNVLLGSFISFWGYASKAQLYFFKYSVFYLLFYHYCSWQTHQSFFYFSVVCNISLRACIHAL